MEDLNQFENFAQDNKLEQFYKEIYNLLFDGENSKMNKKMKQKMHTFSLAYDIAVLNLNDEKVKDYNNKIKQKLEQIKNHDNLEKGQKESKRYFKEIIVILLKDFYKDLGNDKTVFKKIFGKYIYDLLGKNKEIEELSLKEKLSSEVGTVELNIEDILKRDDFKNLKTEKEKIKYLNEKGFYKNRGVENNFEKILEMCEINEEDIEQYRKQFNVAYDLAKYKFRHNERKDGDRYFDHLLSVMNYYLVNEENPTFEGAMIALLHDIVEDTDIGEKTLEHFFGDRIAVGVVNLSKTSVEQYLNDQEKNFFVRLKESGFLNNKGSISDEIIFKERKGRLTEEESKNLEKYYDIENKYKKTRNEDYFQYFLEKGNRNNLSDYEMEEVKIKFYDRIHNTQTLLGFGKIDKILEKIDETIDYFLEINSPKFDNVKQLLVEELLNILNRLYENDSYNEIFGNNYKVYNNIIYNKIILVDSYKGVKQKIRDIQKNNNYDFLSLGGFG